jgi:predicted ATP-dependent endonuclease of OLD family
MIRKLRFENFCSFGEEVEVDFTTSAKAPQDASLVELSDGTKGSLLTGVFGPNAAGKTNLLKALSFASYFLRDSYQMLQPEELIPVDRFEGASPDDSVTWFEVEFEGISGRFLYGFRLKPDAVLEEVIKRQDPKTRQFRQLLHRKWSDDGPPVLRSFEGFTNLTALRGVLNNRPNASLLAAGLQTGQKEYRDIADALSPILSNVGRFGKRVHLSHSLSMDLFQSSEFFQKHPEHHDALRELLIAADFGIVDFKIEPVKIQSDGGSPRESHLVFFIHEGAKGEFVLPANRESSGTQRLFILLEDIISILNSGGMAIVDEMESDLHPHLIPTILNLFRDPEINKHQAQLFFTCHHMEMLNHLAKEQIYFVEKNDDCVSEAFRLDQIKGVRREENFFANYNSGRYGALPEPELVAF